jgi:steroid delta-isomerase-like uncharacterized protein
MNVMQQARRWFEEGWNARNEAVMREIIDPEAFGLVESGLVRSAEAFFQEMYRPFVRAFPDLRLEVVSTFSDGENVCIRWRASGTHLGDDLGMPATGRHVHFRGITWQRYRGGRLVEGEDGWNLGGVLAALQSGQGGGSVAVMATPEPLNLA